jgi:hypothetical protein
VSTIILGAAAAVAVACPAHVLWQMRRGRRPSCAPVRSDESGVEALRQRQRDLHSRIAELNRRG